MLSFGSKFLISLRHSDLWNAKNSADFIDSELGYIKFKTQKSPDLARMYVNQRV